MMTPKYNTMTFSEVFNNSEQFVEDWENQAEGMFASAMTSANVKKLYYLLLARYGNSPIANNDVNQFKLKVHSIMFKNGTAWQKQLEIQTNLANMTEEDLQNGSKTIMNRASNPSSAPSTSTLTELDYIDEQTTDGVKRGKLEAYNLLVSLLKTDVTSEFINKFKVCFKTVVGGENPILYVEESEEEL